MRKAIAIACGVFLLGWIVSGQSTQPRSPIPTVTYTEGTVTIDGTDAQSGDSVPAGSLVVTGANSLVEIQFNTRNVIKLLEKTTLVFDPGNLSKGSELREGALILILRKLLVGANGQALRVRTQNGTAGVRGTSFFMKVESPTSTYVCACNGDVQVLDNDDGPLKDLAASHHSALWIADEGGTPRLTEAPLLYHTDADMEKAAADIGFTIDWNVVDR